MRIYTKNIIRYVHANGIHVKEYETCTVQNVHMSTNVHILLKLNAITYYVQNKRYQRSSKFLQIGVSLKYFSVTSQAIITLFLTSRAIGKKFLSIAYGSFNKISSLSRKN